ncbi:hypothetical protein [Kitasatospora sp. NPDC056184]|uniref:hypothetical protein n=1 Tax=Kitasatospora sp. NPDC056184 TaxID=3345738 RepID=UPI0035DB2204
MTGHPEETVPTGGPAWHAEVARLLGDTAVGERAGMRRSLAEDLAAAGPAAASPAPADGPPVRHRIALLHATPPPAGWRELLVRLLDSAATGTVRHDLLDAPVGPAAVGRPADGAARPVRQAHAVLVLVDYPALERAAADPPPGEAARPRAATGALRRVLPAAVAAVGADRTAVVVLGTDTLGVSARPHLAVWSAATVRRVFGESLHALPVVPVLTGRALAARTEREAADAGLADLTAQVLEPWTASAPAAVAALARRRYGAALRASAQGFARTAEPDWPGLQAARLSDPAYARELHEKLIATACGPLVADALSDAQEGAPWTL